MASITPSPKDLVWVVSNGGVAAGFDPDGPRAGTSYHTVHLPHEPLTTPRIALDEHGVRYPVSEDLQPRLAVAWEPSDDYQTWTIRLRPGVKSHAGNELTADDVKWSWDRTYALRGVGVWRSRRMAGVDSSDDVEVLDRHTLRFKLIGPNPEFPQYLLFATNNVVDSTVGKQHATDDDPWAVNWLKANPSGFGAFHLDSRDASFLRFRARDEYWAGRPGLDTVTQVAASYREEGLRMLERGDANAILSLYSDEIRRFEGRPGYTTMQVKANHSTLEFNYLEAPFDDQNVRRAVCSALPYHDIITKVYGGYARLSKSPLGNVSKFYTEEFWHYDTDIEKARELLKASAHADGFETELYVHPTVESIRFGEVVRTALKPLGIDVEIRLIGTRLPYGTKVPMWFKEECGHAVYEPMYDLGHDYDQPLGMMGGRVIRDKRWTDRLRQIRRSPSADQERLYREIQRDIVEFAPCAHIAEIQTGWVFRGNIDPWALSADCLSINTTVWSQHRQTMGWW